MRSIAGLLATLFGAAALDAQSPSALPVWRLVEEYRVDGNQHELTTVNHIVQARNGDVFITQQRDNQIRVFSGAGQPIRAIGRKGQGPGEFEWLSAIGFVGDTLFATDNQLRRISLFASDGKLIRSFSVAPPPRDPGASASGAQQLFIMPAKLMPNNRGYGEPVVAVRDLEALKLPRPIYAVDWTGKPIRQIALLSRTSTTLVIPTNGGMIMRSQPFSDDTQYAFAPSGERVAIIEWSAASRTITVVDIALGGDTIGRRAIPYAPQRIPARVVDSAVGVVQKLVAARNAQTDARQHFHLPDNFPAVTSALMENDGTLWLRTSPVTERSGRYLIVSPRGQIIGTVDVPATTTLQSITGGAWATVLDEDDVPSVVRYRIERTVRR